VRAAVVYASVVYVACATASLGGAGAAEIAPGVTLSGDLRLRSESLFRNGAFVVTDDVHHARLRLRLGLYVTVDERWDLGLRLATGGGTTSTDQDLDSRDTAARENQIEIDLVLKF